MYIKTYSHFACGTKSRRNCKKSTDYMSAKIALLTSINALNVYQSNIFQTLIFIKLNSNLFLTSFKISLMKKKLYSYTLKSSGNYYVPFKKSKLSQFSISFRGPHHWNTILKNETELKNTSSLSFFKRKLKSLIMSTENITNYF